MSIVRYADSRDIELNTSRETSYLQATMYHLVYHINTSQTRNSENTLSFIHCAKQCGRHVRSCLAISNTRAKKSSSFFTTSVFSQWWKFLKKKHSSLYNKREYSYSATSGGLLIARKTQFVKIVKRIKSSKYVRYGQGIKQHNYKWV